MENDKSVDVESTQQTETKKTTTKSTSVDSKSTKIVTKTKKPVDTSSSIKKHGVVEESIETEVIDGVEHVTKKVMLEPDELKFEHHIVVKNNEETPNPLVSIDRSECDDYKTVVTESADPTNSKIAIVGSGNNLSKETLVKDLELNPGVIGMDTSNSEDVSSGIEKTIDVTPDSIEDTDIPSVDIIKKAKASEKNIVKTLNDLKSSHPTEKQVARVRTQLAKDSAAEILEKNADKIDYSKVIFAETDVDKLEPVITDENLAIFKAATVDAFDEETVKMWIEIAKADIQEYKDMIDNAKIHLENKPLYSDRYNAMMECANFDEDDKEYAKQLFETKDKARDLLAIIQLEAIEIEKDFKENKIAESTMKAFTLNMIKDFTVSSFRLSSTLRHSDLKLSEQELKMSDDNVRIKNELRENLYLPVIYNEYNRRNAIMNEKYSYNRFGANYFNKQIGDFIDTIRIRVAAMGSETTEDVLDDKGMVCGKKTVETPFDIGPLVGRDIEAMNFTIHPIMYAYLRYDKSGVITKIIKDGSKASQKLEEVINLNGYYISKTDDAPIDVSLPDKTLIFKSIYDSVEQLISKLKIESNVIMLKTLAEKELRNDKFFKKHYSDLNIDGGVDALMKLTEFLPEIKGKHIGEWAEAYPPILKFNKYDLFKTLLLTIQSDDEDHENNVYRTAFNTALRLISDENKYLFCSLISNLNDWLKSTTLIKEDQQAIFGNMMSFFNFQFNIGYRLAYDTETQASGNGLYEFVRKVLAANYGDIIVSEDEDTMLKDIDLTNVRFKYYSTANNIIKDTVKNLTVWEDIADDNEKLKSLFLLNGNDVTPKVKKNKKKSKSRR